MLQLAKACLTVARLLTILCRRSAPGTHAHNMWRRLDEDLIQQDSEFKGTRELGMCLASQQGVASTGTTLRIMQHANFPDGRMHVDTSGGCLAG